MLKFVVFLGYGTTIIGSFDWWLIWKKFWNKSTLAYMAVLLFHICVCLNLMMFIWWPIRKSGYFVYFFMCRFIRKAMQCIQWSETVHWYLCYAWWSLWRKNGALSIVNQCLFTKWDCAFVNVWPPCSKGFLAIHN